MQMPQPVIAPRCIFVFYVWCYLCCILLSIAGQWGVGVRRVTSFLGFEIYQEA
jgi:hypothetical protein